MLGEVTAEKTRAHASVEECGEPMEEVGQENLKKLPPDTNESCANDAAMEICTRDTASIDVPIKKDPMEDVCQESLSKPLPNEPENFANDELARQKLDSSSEIGSKQLDEFASSEVKKKVPDEPPKEESKNGGTKTDTDIISILFLLYDCTVLAGYFIAMEQASLGIKGPGQQVEQDQGPAHEC